MSKELTEEEREIIRRKTAQRVAPQPIRWYPEIQYRGGVIMRPELFIKIDTTTT